jgi:uncharacterized protein with FMN-binding domain
MYKVAAALIATFAGLAMLLTFKSHPTNTTSSALDTQQSSEPAVAPDSNGAAATGKGKGKKKKGAAATYTGNAFNTQYGTMQVAAVVKAGKITDVRVLKQTNTGPQSDQIDANALPKLKTAAIRAQSAKIDVVSGATYTSTGYAKSLQSALDKAGL